MGKPKVLMFGWEFPPYSKGGLGTACYGLTKALNSLNYEIYFVIPFAPDGAEAEFVKLISANNLDVKVKAFGIKTLLHPYITEEEYFNKYEIIKKTKPEKEWKIYGKNLYEEVLRFAAKAAEIAKSIDFDIIHAHDWLTFLAGIEAKRISGKPLIIQVHATEFDRSPFPNKFVYDIEKKGMENADLIVAVSNYTKNIICQKYGIPESKVVVVHNGINYNENNFVIEKKDKVVLFLGRITYQKGPEYFIDVAKKVLQFEPDTKFIIAGDGDMMRYIIEKVAQEGLSRKILFTGFLRGKDIDRAYALADVYVMPSRSEPFGITPLEAIKNGTPVIISKQSGVSEVLENAFKVDFWDVDEMVNKIVAILRYKALHDELVEHAREELKRISWQNAAHKLDKIYSRIVTKAYF